MGLITYALLVAASWYVSYRFAVEHLKDELQQKREKYARRMRHSSVDDPDTDPYPWSQLAVMTTIPALILMVVAVVFAIFWKTTWFLAFLIALYAFVPPVKNFVHRTWDRLVAKKASIEAKLRG